MKHEEKSEAGHSVDLSIGKEIDAALGEVIRGLLKRPAEETGNLISDGIGLLGDKVRRKRLVNAQLGLDEVRQLLESNSVKLKDITPPSEEELHVVLEGMSLSSDNHIRNLWSGLLATALTPDGIHRVERPITTIISSLSPADARIIEFGAFVTKEQKAMQHDAEVAAEVVPGRLRSLADASRIEKALEGMRNRKDDIFTRATHLYQSHGLEEVLLERDWYENLDRLGLTVGKPDRHRTSKPTFPK